METTLQDQAILNWQPICGRGSRIIAYAKRLQPRNFVLSIMIELRRGALVGTGVLALMISRGFAGEEFKEHKDARNPAERTLSMGALKLLGHPDVPVTLKFSPESMLESGYGRNWMLSLQGYRAYQEEENRIIAHLPNGEAIYFAATANKDGELISHDRRWKCIKRANILCISNESGISYEFDKGMLSAIQTSKQRYTVEGSRTGNLVVAAGAKTLFSTKRGANQVTLTMEAGETSLNLVKGDHLVSITDPSGRKLEVQPLAGSIQQVLELVGRTNLSPQELDQIKTYFSRHTGGLQTLEILSLAGPDGAISSLLVWDPASKELLFDLQDGKYWCYESFYQKEEGKMEVATSSIKRSNASGSEGYGFNFLTGVETLTSKVGDSPLHSIRRLYVLSKGKNYGLIRRIEESKAEGAPFQTTFSASFDEKGNIIRTRNGEGLVTHVTVDKTEKITDLKKEDGTHIYKYEVINGEEIRTFNLPDGGTLVIYALVNTRRRVLLTHADGKVIDVMMPDERVQALMKKFKVLK